MNKFYFIILLVVCASCQRSQAPGKQESTVANVPEQLPYDQSEGMDILIKLGKVYGNDSTVAGLSLETPNCPDFIEGIYFDKAELVFQISGDTLKARRELEKAAGNKHFRIEQTGGNTYSQKELFAIQEELTRKLEGIEYENIKKNITGYGSGLSHIEIHLIVNTPEKRKEFREKVMDSPAFRFTGVEVPVINEKVGSSDTLGIRIRPEYPVYFTDTEQVTLILSNNSGTELTCGEHYYITYEDEKGVWRELPMNSNFFDIGYRVLDKGERTMTASLYPDVHPNKPGRYRYFYKVTVNKKDILMMAEFRLAEDGKEKREAQKIPLP